MAQNRTTIREKSLCVSCRGFGRCHDFYTMPKGCHLSETCMEFTPKRLCSCRTAVAIEIHENSLYCLYVYLGLSGCFILIAYKKSNKFANAEVFNILENLSLYPGEPQSLSGRTSVSILDNLSLYPGEPLSLLRRQLC